MTTSKPILTGILIDPIKRSVARVQVEPQDDGYYNRTISDLLGCDWIERVVMARDGIGGGVDMWIDEEGLLTQPNPRGYFRVLGEDGSYVFSDYVFPGRALILGYDAAGNTTDCPAQINVSRVHSIIEWVDFDQLDPNGPTLNPVHTLVTYNADGSEATRQEMPCHVTRTDQTE
jgi:hypothetical protein